PFATGPVTWKGQQDVDRDIANITHAADQAGALEAFVPSASIGIVHEIMANQYYPSEEAYAYALADALRQEYQSIARAGLIVQIDAPDAAMGRHTQYRKAPLEDFRKALHLRVEAQNHALANVAPEQVRY